ncbi:MAG TPA: neprosin family prolyl endopeptidase, partial [Allocoleopsis sp.]
VIYTYAGAGEFKIAIGGFASLSQHQPYLASSDYHSLSEIAVESADNQQIVEVGWTVDKSVNKGDSSPHLFVYHWVDGQGTCYNGCGFVQFSTTRYPGMKVAVTSSPQQAAIKYSNGNWWVWYQNEWIGYFPGSAWSNNFTQAGLIQWFGEVASSQSQTCTDMGNGKFGTAIGSAVFSNMRILLSPTTSEPANTFSYVTQPSYYNLRSFQSSRFHYGGPGGC